MLDRNGLRPSRYYITADKRLILSSEVGVLDVPPEQIVRKSRLTPGKMLLVDTREGRIIEDDELKEGYAARAPYGQWLDNELVHLKDLPIPSRSVPKYSHEERKRLMKAFGYTYENLKTAVLPMALTGAEPTASMGIDSPLPVLSNQHQPLFNYFKQFFAQVTNTAHRRHPGGDCHRHQVYLGTDGNLLEDKESNCHVLRVNNPILTNLDMLKIRDMKEPASR